MHVPIILVGPVFAGKSTLAALLAPQLGLPRIAYDDLRIGYYQEIGYSVGLAERIRARGGMLALVLYWQLFESHAVERVLADHPVAVIDMGGGVGVADSLEQQSRVQRALTPYANIILILPSPDRAESLAVLRARDSAPPPDLNFEFHAHSLAHPGYRSIAKHVVYTQGKRPEESCAEILSLVGARDRQCLSQGATP